MTMNSWSKKVHSEHIMPQHLRDLDRALQVGLTHRSGEADTLAAARRRLLAERARVSSSPRAHSRRRRASGVLSLSIVVTVVAWEAYRQAWNPLSERIRTAAARFKPNRLAR
jgi:hypothetical protein